MVNNINAQQWFDANYPKEKRSKIKNLDICNRNLEGDLKLEGFVKITYINFSSNHLTFLDITDCKKLETLYFNDNQITRLDLSQNLQLKELSIASNNFAKQDLSFLSHLVNLESLDVSNRYNKKNHNHFVGSLEPLKYLTKLRGLNISNTDIEEGLEYLPNSLEKIDCSIIGQRLDTKVSKIREKLAPYDEYDYQTWRKDNKELVEKVQKENWKEKGFSEEESNQLIKLGLGIKEWDFVDYLKEKGCSYSPSDVAKIKELREEYNKFQEAQVWLEKNYHVKEQGKVSKEVTINSFLGDVPAKHWDKVNFDKDWDKEYEDKSAETPLMTGTWGYKGFQNQEILDKFINYSDKPDEDCFSKTGGGGDLLVKDIKLWDRFDISGRKVTDFLDKKKLFENGVPGKAKDQKAFEFLHSIISPFNNVGIKNVDIKFTQGDEFSLKDWNKLTISDKYLKGELDLSDFVNLETLNCENNRLTNLDLSNCKKLTHFNYFNFKKLKVLNISDCHSLGGSLKQFTNLKNLRELNITNTNISEGLEYLPTSCKKIYCNSDYQSKSTKIINELEKYGKCSEGEGGNKYYNLDKWKENKQNDLAVSIISPERLFTIRSNIKQFVNKWGKKENPKDGNNVDWYNKFLTKKEAKNELSKLRTPEELHNYYNWKIYTAQFIGRGAAVAGAVLTFREYGAIGGGILGVYPFTELLVSRLEKNLEIKESKWKEFLADADGFLDNYNGLLGILAQFEIKELKEGKINTAIKDLDEKVGKFLEIYDKNEDKEIDINELVKDQAKRNTLAKDLEEWDEKKEKGEEESNLQAIINAVKELEKAVIEYRRISYYGESEKVAESSLDEKGNSSEINHLEEEFKENQQEIDFDEWEKGQFQTQIEIPPKNN